MKVLTSAGLSIALLLQALPAVAAQFPDVPETHLHAEAIDYLVSLKVVTGNPDGNFYPNRPVNRAEFLTMLYRLKGVTPSAASRYCFLQLSDIPNEAWFADVVCDALREGYVSGYANKTFRPQQAVNRVEALKMLFTVLGLDLSASAGGVAAAQSNIDVAANAWYMQYVAAAYSLQILPIAGQDAVRLYPDQVLLRGEAAAYLTNATTELSLDASEDESVSSTETEGSSASSAEGSVSSVSLSSRSTTDDAASVTNLSIIKQVDYPFGDDGVFVGKQTISYRFPVKQAAIASIKVTASNGATQGEVTCRLYKLGGGDNNFSLEYYIGLQQEGGCSLRTALTPGSYQMDIQPRTANATFTVYAKTVKGDGNDGFSQAKNLIKGAPKSGQIETDDPSDWYTFKLSSQTSTVLELTNEANLKCLIYPMEDVDIYGFSGPQCNQQYDFPSGTYYIGVMQRDNRTSKQNYSVRLK